MSAMSRLVILPLLLFTAAGWLSSAVAIEVTAPDDQPTSDDHRRPAQDQPLAREHLLVSRARIEAIRGDLDTALTLIEAYRNLYPDDPVAERLQLSMRIEMRRAETRQILRERVAEKHMVLGDPDYEAAKAQASLPVIRGLRAVEHLIHEQRFTQAVDLCERIVLDYEDAKPAMILLDRLLHEINRNETETLRRERARRRGEVDIEIGESGMMPRAPAPRPRPVLIFDEDIEALERQALQRRLALTVPAFNYKDATIADVLEELFAFAGLDYIVIDGSLPDTAISAYLVDRSVEQILSVIQRMVDVHFNYHSGMVYITNSENPILVTRIIRLRSGLTNVLRQRQISGGGGEEAGTPNLMPPDAGGDNESDLERFLNSIPNLIHWPENSEYYLERKSNSLYVKSTPAAIAEVERLLHALDYNSAMVMIETKFVEVSNEAARNLGVNWGLMGRSSRSDGTVVWGTGRGTPWLPSDPSGSPEALASDFLGMSGPGLTTAIAGIGDGIRPNFSVMLSALETRGHANVLSAPQIITLNNSTGIIDLSRDVPYISGYDNISVAGNIYNTDNDNINTQTTQLPVPRWDTVKEGFTLQIQPSIARNSDIITLELVPTVTSVESLRESQVPGISEGAATNVAIPRTEQPLMRTRTVSTTLHVKDGDTVALGGLITEEEGSAKSGIPGVMNVPGLGRLFRTDNDNLRRSKLMIFVTAHIIDPSGSRYSDEIRYLRDTARITLPASVREELRAREHLEAEEARRQATEQAEQQRGMRRALRGDQQGRGQR